MSDDERVPPTRVRIEKLQEVHVGDLVKLDHAASQAYWDLGFDGAEVPAKTAGDFYRLARSHAVRVAEADGDVAGYAAWHDEAPGVAVLAEIAVHPALQRFGIGRKLVDRVVEEARDHGFSELALRMSTRAEWAVKFYEALGFASLEPQAALPEKLKHWWDEKTADGDKPFLRPGERVLWKSLVTAGDDDEETG